MRRKMPPAPPPVRPARLALALALLLTLLAAAAAAAAAASAHAHDVTRPGRSAERAAAASPAAEPPPPPAARAPRPRRWGGGGGRNARASASAASADILAAEAERGWCRYGGRRHAAGARVATPEPCLRCRCARGALVCFLRVCPALPDPPPPRCLLHHASGACCPTLRCPEDGSPRRRLADAAAAGGDGDADGAGAERLGDDGAELTFPAPFGGGCAHGGSLYAAGSAMSSASACEHCFCIGGRRRCVRPSCLPPPAGCEPEPAAGGLCCPARYRCTRLHHPAAHTGCTVRGRRYAEGERVGGAAAGASACDHCFCLRGLVRCLASTCAPPLLGCEPLLRDAECCPHSYHCGVPSLDLERESFDFLGVTDNFLTSVKNEDRSFRGGLLDRSEPTTRLAVEPVTATDDSRRTTQLPKKRKTSTRKTQHTTASLSRKTTNHKAKEVARNNEVTASAPTPEHNTRPASASTATPDDVSAPSTESASTTTAPTTASQPDETMRIVINGTVNCTAELSTDHSPPSDGTEERTPNVDRADELSTEGYTFDPNELITDRPTDTSGDDDASGGLRIPQGEDTFMVNVSTLLRTNTTAATLPPAAPIPAEIAALLNMSKKKDEYDYDYGEATLPPSLPNLKIIPFVAADAVVESAQAEPAPELTYAPLEREDKFPVYFPSAERDRAGYSAAEHAFDPTQFPAYGGAAAAETDYRRRLESLSSLFAALNGDRTTEHHRIEDDYSLVTSRSKFDVTEFPTDDVSKLSTPNPHFGGKTHAVNLFSPPVETEGGFLPKEPPVLHDYYGPSYARPSASHAYSPPPPPVDIAHHAPSINFDKHKECISAGGVRVAPGEALEAGEAAACARCVCTWGVLLCAEPACAPAPPGCTLAPPTHAHCCPLHCDNVVNQTIATTEQPSPVSSNTPADAAPNSQAPSVAISTEPPPPLNVAPAPGPLVETAKDHVGDISPNSTEYSTVVTLDPSVGNRTKSIDSFTDGTETPSSTTPSSTTLPPTSPPLPAATSEANQNWNSDAPTSGGDYEESVEEEEEEDGGFSFGSVLKLLLSDSYDSTTTAPYRHRTTAASVSPAPSRPPSPSTAAAPVVVTTAAAPSSSTWLPHRPPAVRPALVTAAGAASPAHLVLGAMSSIDRHPVTARPLSTAATTLAPPRAAPGGLRIEENLIGGAGGGFGGGMLKLAGCNIYGRMYRVGRIIAELSSACLQCMCTELGVQCAPLRC